MGLLLARDSCRIKKYRSIVEIDPPIDNFGNKMIILKIATLRNYHSSKSHPINMTLTSCILLEYS